MAPVSRLPVTFQINASRMRPPSRGLPGSRLKPATTRFDQVSEATITAGNPGDIACSPNQPRPANTRFAIGPATEMAAEIPGVRSPSPKLVWPPQNVSTYSRTRMPRARATAPWASSCANTETNSRIGKDVAAATAAGPDRSGAAACTVGRNSRVSMAATNSHDGAR